MKKLAKIIILAIALFALMLLTTLLCSAADFQLVPNGTYLAKDNGKVCIVKTLTVRNDFVSYVVLESKDTRTKQTTQARFKAKFDILDYYKPTILNDTIFVWNKNRQYILQAIILERTALYYKVNIYPGYWILIEEFNKKYEIVDVKNELQSKYKARR